MIKSRRTFALSNAPAIMLGADIVWWLDHEAGGNCRFGEIAKRLERAGSDRPEITEAVAALIGLSNLWEVKRAANLPEAEAPIDNPPEVPAHSKDEELGTTEAAPILGVSDRAVRQRCQEGRLPARQVHGRWVIRRSDLGV